MSGFLHQLENNEAILLMYIAGELPEEDRREVEQMLTVDASLRQMHEELRGSVASAMSAVEELDALTPPGLPRDVAARRVGRMVRQWHAARLAAPRVLAPVPAPRRVPWYISTSVAAALIGIGLIAWWGFSPEVIPSPARELAGNDSGFVTPDGEARDESAGLDGPREPLAQTPGNTPLLSPLTPAPTPDLAGPNAPVAPGLTTDADFSAPVERTLAGGLLAGWSPDPATGHAAVSEEAGGFASASLGEMEREATHLSELSSAH